MASLKVLTELPESLKTLIRCVVTSFYSVECTLLMDLLIHHPGIKEDDLLDLLKFDRKQLRATVSVLKQDQFISSRIQMETDAEGKATRHNYYYINYSTFVNVVKYKLENIRRKIEFLERSSTVRASFKCPECKKTFTDLDTGQLFDPMQGIFLCTFCGAEVEEEVVSTSVHLSRLLMTTFNEQTEPLFVLLKDTDGIQLSASVLEPALLLSKNKSTASRSINDERMRWSGEATKNKNFGFTENEITISMDNNSASSTTTKPNKLPIWMTESTIEGNMETSSTNMDFDNGNSSSLATNHLDTNDIMRTLLSHEKTSTSHSNNQPLDAKNSASEFRGNFQIGVKEESNSSLHRGDDDNASDDESDEEVTVTINGRTIAYTDVTPEMIANMTETERNEYTRVGQELHEMYS